MSKNILGPAQRIYDEKSPDIIRFYQNEKLRNLLEFVWENSVFYRNFYEAQGLRKSDISVLTVNDLPIIDKNIITQNPNYFSQIITDPAIRLPAVKSWLLEKYTNFRLYKNKYLVVKSSSSTMATSSTPAIHIYDINALQCIQQCIIERLCPVLNVTGKIKLTFIGKMGDNTAGELLTRAAPSDKYDLTLISSFDPINVIAKKVAASSPHILGGYPGIIGSLAHLALDGTLHIQPQHVNISGEPLSVELYHVIKKLWNPSIHNIYACTESLAGIGVQKNIDDDFSVFNDLHIIEILDESNKEVEPDQIGNIVLTNLYNFTYPLIRFRINDLALKSNNKKSHGIFKSIVGRTYEILYLAGQQNNIISIPAIDLAGFKIEGVNTLQFITNNKKHLQIIYTSESVGDSLVYFECKKFLNYYKVMANLDLKIEKREFPKICPVSGKAKRLTIKW